jgi:hypothetical protein
MDIKSLVAYTITALQTPGGDFALNVASNALWDLIKRCFQKRSAAAKESIEDIEKAPNEDLNWNAFKTQLNKALKEDEAFRKELQALLPKQTNQTISQENITIGNGNVSFQSVGTGNNFSANKGS